MIYELRVYKCVPGRLPALLNRFANITLKIYPEWLAKRAETEKDGAIVANVSNQLLAPTAFSSVK